MGKIILPAVLIHGAYDFFLLWIEFLEKRHGVFSEADGDNAMDQYSVIANVTSFLLSFTFVVGSLVCFRVVERQQRCRLQEIDGAPERVRGTLA